MNTRRGVSIIELLVIMTACTTLLTLTGVLLSRMMRIHADSRAKASAEHTVTRLAEHFRSDVHQASAVTTESADAKGVFLRLKLANGRAVEYSRTTSAVLRFETGGDRPQWREEFAFPGSETLTIERQNAPLRLVLTIVRSAKELAPTDVKTLSGPGFVSISLCAEAVIGRDLRFKTPSSSEESRP